ncbi:MAG: hypothetical protein LLG40_02885 [Deltaproteobacteria bacterium]|nr:hypothetical protein [Deltaproteobacteria bacterium]
MKKVLLFFVLICLLILQGCAGGKVNANNKWIKVDYKKLGIGPSKYIKNYTLGKTQSVFIGQAIINVEICDGIKKEAILGLDNFLTFNYGNTFHLKHENISPILGTVEYEGKTYYVTHVVAPNKTSWGILISDDGSIKQGILYSHYYELLFLSDSIVTNPESASLINSCVSALPSSISFEFIFGGKNDVSLNTTYREYSNTDMARPAFFQNITYQPNAKQIRFKNFVIQIHNVTNEQITYTVLEDGLK